MLYLIVIELSEVLHVYLCLLGIHHCGKGVEHQFRNIQTFHSVHYIREFAYSRGFDQDPVGMELLHHLLKGVTEVSHQAAADASCVHFVYDHSRILQESAVYADLAEFVFDENDLFSLIGFLNEFFDECCLAGSQKSAENINFCHFLSPLAIHLGPVPSKSPEYYTTIESR